ncbi:unnamed protein product [Prorocentrum cordatum]|uniref:Chloride channel protein n=1 Tax=Prorocentrum cordatum TaxID=2364126 RepID=A0ABN9T684_9DINO|nr:unnamed protein product [Polarella glacialis]
MPAPLRDALIVFGPPFVHRKRFWVTMVAAWLVGAVDALVGLLFYWCFERGSGALWYTPAFEEAMSGDGWGLLQGQWWYVPMGAGGGLALAVFKAAYGTFVTVLPDSVPPMFTEIKDPDTVVHDWKAAPGVFVMGLISLSCGSSLGPEATMAFVGGTVGYFVWRLTDRFVAFGLEEDVAAETVPSCGGDPPPTASSSECGLRQEGGDALDAGGTVPLPEELEAQPELAATVSGPPAAPTQGLRTPTSVEEGSCGDAVSLPDRANSKRNIRFSERDRKLLILAGISGAMGAVFPSPLVPAILIARGARRPGRRLPRHPQAGRAEGHRAGEADRDHGLLERIVRSLRSDLVENLHEGDRGLGARSDRIRVPAGLLGGHPRPVQRCVWAARLLNELPREEVRSEAAPETEPARQRALRDAASRPPARRHAGAGGRWPRLGALRGLLAAHARRR